MGLFPHVSRVVVSIGYRTDTRFAETGDKLGSRRSRITKRSVDAVPVPVEGEERLWDTDLKGFFLRVYASGRRVYAVKYRIGAMQRIYTIGTHGSPLTPEDARREADRALRRAKDGEDPAVAKQEARQAISVAGLIDRYLDQGPATKPSKRASSWANDFSNLERHIRPLLGRKMADSVTKADAARAAKDIAEGRTARDERTSNRGGRARVTGGSGAAHRTIATAAAMYAWGIEHGYAKSNPFCSVRLSPPPARERFLSREEAGRLLEALEEGERDKTVGRTFGDAIRLLLLTGARKTEILALRWSEVDVDRMRLVLPPERTKAGGQNGDRYIQLSPPALEILLARRPDDAAASAYIFPAARGDGHCVGLRKVFVDICKRAGLTDVRIHDLRHSFASFAIADGASLFLISKLLGHASARTSERYAHLGGDPLQDAVALIGRRLMPAPLQSSGDVIDMHSSAARRS